MAAGKGVVKGLGGKGMWPGGPMGLGGISPCIGGEHGGGKVGRLPCSSGVKGRRALPGHVC